MTYALCIILIFLGVRFRKNRYVVFSISLFIFIMFGFNRGLADEWIYKERLSLYTSYASSTEIGFSLIMKIVSLLGLDYYQWLIILSCIYVICLYFTCKITAGGNSGFPLAMLMIFPLCMDAVQQRQSLASCLGWLGISLLCYFNSKGYTRKLIVYGVPLLLIASAVTIHFDAIFYLLVFIVFFLNKEQTIITTVIGTLITSLSSTNLLVKIFLRIFPSLSSKLSFTILSASRRYDASYYRITWFRMVLILLSYIIPILWIKYGMKRRINSFQKFILRANIIMVTTFPLIVISVNFYRIQQFLIIFDYCAVATVFSKPRKGTIRKKEAILILIVVLFSIVNLYFLVLNNGNLNSVFIPFMDNNAIIP